MLARSGQLPSGDYAYEVKWDGFRAIVSTEGTLRVRSRRGWNMTEHVGFLADLPVRAVLDGELIALDVDQARLPGVVPVRAGDLEARMLGRTFDPTEQTSADLAAPKAAEEAGS